jgi:ribosomal protein S18 acetylase RimI-like enzyme
MGAGATTLREATTADMPTLLALVHAAFEEYRGRLDPPSGALAETLETLALALRTGSALLASVDDQPAGCVFFHREHDHVYLGRLSVLTAYRHHGLGGVLTDGVEHRALAMGVPRVELGVRIALPALRAYYERRGYRVIRHEAHAGYTAPTSVVMRKELR